VLILVLEHVVKTQYAMLSTTSQCVVVQLVWQEMRLLNVDLTKVRINLSSLVSYLMNIPDPQLLLIKTHATHRLVVKTANAEKSMDKPFAHAFQAILEVLLLADLNVL
jgi:hypothetical protein